MENKELTRKSGKILSEENTPTKESAKSQLDACTAQCLKGALKTTAAERQCMESCFNKDKNIISKLLLL